MNEPDSIGYRIINEIANHGLAEAVHGGCEPIIIWSANAADQLDALIATHTAELTRQLDAATETADTAAAEAAELDILLSQITTDLCANIPFDHRIVAATSRILRFRNRNHQLTDAHPPGQ